MTTTTKTQKGGKKNIDPELQEWAERWKLDDYELELEQAIADGDFTVPPNQKQLKQEAMAAARNHLKKDARLNMRISSFDLMRLKERAAIEGIPYQTLASSIIHKYINGTLS